MFSSLASRRMMGTEDASERQALKTGSSLLMQAGSSRSVVRYWLACKACIPAEWARVRGPPELGRRKAGGMGLRALLTTAAAAGGGSGGGGGGRVRGVAACCSPRPAGAGVCAAGP